MRWYKLHQLESTHSRWFDKNQINTRFRQYSCNRNILASPVHSTVHISPIFSYESASAPPSPSRESPAEIMKPKGNPNPCNSPPNPLPNVPADSDSDPISSDSPSSKSYDSLDDNYYKKIRHAKKDKNKRHSKTCFGDPINNWAKLAAKLITAAYKSELIKFTLE